jgi:SAM-dependent methyltransferase
MLEKQIFEAKIDKSDYENESDPITSHSRIAEVYKYRPPYQKEFFQQASSRLGLTKETELLDLCCGRGELSAGFCSYVNRINAVDGSNEMLKNAVELENVTYHQADVNLDEMAFIGEVDHITIGSAVHWIDGEKLAAIIRKNLAADGKIFVSHTLFNFDGQSYALALQDLNAKYGQLRPHVDLRGNDKFKACGFVPVDTLRLVRNVSFGIEYLYRNQLSYAYREFYKKISESGGRYRADFMDTVSPFGSNGKVSATLVNWAVIYSASGSAN